MKCLFVRSYISQIKLQKSLKQFASIMMFMLFGCCWMMRCVKMRYARATFRKRFSSHFPNMRMEFFFIYFRFSQTSSDKGMLIKISQGIFAFFVLCTFHISHYNPKWLIERTNEWMNDWLSLNGIESWKPIDFYVTLQIPKWKSKYALDQTKFDNGWKMSATTTGNIDWKFKCLQYLKSRNYCKIIVTLPFARVHIINDKSNSNGICLLDRFAFIFIWVVERKFFLEFFFSHLFETSFYPQLRKLIIYLLRKSECMR